MVMTEYIRYNLCISILDLISHSLTLLNLLEIPRHNPRARRGRHPLLGSVGKRTSVKLSRSEVHLVNAILDQVLRGNSQLQRQRLLLTHASLETRLARPRDQREDKQIVLARCHEPCAVLSGVDAENGAAETGELRLAVTLADLVKQTDITLFASDSEVTVAGGGDGIEVNALGLVEELLRLGDLVASVIRGSMAKIPVSLVPTIICSEVVCAYFCLGASLLNLK